LLVPFCRYRLTSRVPPGSRKRKKGTFPLLVPACRSWKSPVAVRSCTAEKVFRAYDFEPVFALSASCAAYAPVLTIVLCTVAVPSPAVVTLLHAEKLPDSKPSLKIVDWGTLCTVAVGAEVAVALPGVLLPVTDTLSVLPTSAVFAV
jgi:hypothetical protein